MRIEQLEYIAAVTQHGSLRRASERLHISQPALSEAVSKLERELGVTLLDRRRSGARISRHGRELLQNMVEVLEAVDRLKQAAGDQSTTTRLVRLGTVERGDLDPPGAGDQGLQPHPPGHDRGDPQHPAGRHPARPGRGLARPGTGQRAGRRRPAGRPGRHRPAARTARGRAAGRPPPRRTARRSPSTTSGRSASSRCVRATSCTGSRTGCSAPDMPADLPQHRRGGDGQADGGRGPRGDRAARLQRGRRPDGARRADHVTADRRRPHRGAAGVAAPQPRPRAGAGSRPARPPWSSWPGSSGPSRRPERDSPSRKAPSDASRVELFVTDYPSG